MNKIERQTQSMVIRIATERLRALIADAHAGRTIEIDGIRYVPELNGHD